MPLQPNDLALYPEAPGVYLMKNGAGKVLYIGKAKQLRSRLRQYFGSDTREMIPFLMAQVEKIDILLSLTEKDALLLENTLIKKHKPKYNVLLKDDKSYVSLLLTAHPWPLVQLHRYKGKPKAKGTLFGPYTNAHAARQTLEVLLRIFPLRQCSDAEFASRKRPCLLYDIKKCSAPCVGKCTKEEYEGFVRGAVRLLKGYDKELIRELKGLMEEAAEKLEFERADALLKTVQQIEHTLSVQHVDNAEAKDADAIGFYREGRAAIVALLNFREGKLVSSDHFLFQDLLSDDQESLETFLLQHYTQAPKEILLPIEVAPFVQEILSERLAHRVELYAPKRGAKKDLIEMAERNAKALFIREQDARALQEKRLLDLQESLKLNRFPKRIECLDTSNIQGSYPVASLVAFTHGEPDKKRYRLFKIKESQRSDDYNSMKEVLQRHFKKLKETLDFPDLLILDGGKGQLNLALEVLQSLGIAEIDVVALAKESARHDKGLTQEKVFLPHESLPLFIDPRSPLLFLLQRIRDEAHRSALAFHKKQRSQALFKSPLDSVPGIGPIKKKKLLERFGSLKAIQRATDQELGEIVGEKEIRAIRQLRTDL
jgi:excinuclease ABC subunit C